MQVPIIKLHTNSGIGRVLTARRWEAGRVGGGGGQGLIEYLKGAVVKVLNWIIFPMASSISYRRKFKQGQSL
jgi:hypothetical protein